KHLEKIMLKVIQTFLKDELKSSAGVNEVIPLVPVLDKETTRRLVGKLIDIINHSPLLDYHLLAGLAKVIRSATPAYLSAGDLVNTLERLKDRLQKTFKQDTEQLYQVT